MSRTATFAAAALIALGATACDGVTSDPAARFGATPSSQTSSSTPGPSEPTSPSSSASSSSSAAAKPDQDVDYRPLLLQAEHLSDDEDTFTARQVDQNPRGMPGASAFYVNAQDNRAISNTVVVYPDAATAAATLKQARDGLANNVVGGSPRPVAVGTDGVVISGNSPQGDKSVTELMFTEGRALVRLEFESAVGDHTTDRFVTNVGKMQLIALQTGLPNTE